MRLDFCILCNFTSGDDVSDNLISEEGVPFINGPLKNAIDLYRSVVLKSILGICLCTRCIFIHMLYT